MNYKETVWNKLYRSVTDMGIEIPTKSQNGREYKHILPVSGKDVFEYLGINPRELPLEDLHKDINHLNSSQLLCFNAFSPFILNGEIVKEMGSVLNLPILIGGKCHFEYKDDMRWGASMQLEDTQFDFHIDKSKTTPEIFIEVKFTEDTFGKANVRPDDYHADKANFYREKLCGVVSRKDGENLTEKDIFDNYQLMRNILRTKNKDVVVVFITDNNNRGTNKAINDFCNNYIIHKRDNVIFKTWQEINAAWPLSMEKPFQFCCFEDSSHS